MAGYIGSKGSGIISGIDASIADLNLTDKALANGTTEANKVLTADGDKDVTAIRNLTATGTVTRALTRGSIDVGNSSGVSSALAKGAAGTVLTSDGTDLSFVAASGGGEQTFTATGAIAAGDLVSLNTNGTISKSKPMMGAPSTFSSSDIRDQSASAYDSDTDRVIVAWVDSSTNVGKIAIGTVSDVDNSVSYGTALDFQTGMGAVYYWVKVVYDPSTQRGLVIYLNSAYDILVRTITVTGGSTNTATVGASTVLEAGVIGSQSQYLIGTAFDVMFCPTINKVVAVFANQAGTGRACIIIPNASTNTVTFGTEVTVSTDIEFNFVSMDYDVVNNIVGFSYESDASDAFFNCLTPNADNTVTAGSEIETRNSLSVFFSQCIYDPITDQFALLYSTGSADMYWEFVHVDSSRTMTELGNFNMRLDETAGDLFHYIYNPTTQNVYSFGEKGQIFLSSFGTNSITAYNAVTSSIHWGTESTAQAQSQKQFKATLISNGRVFAAVRDQLTSSGKSIVVGDLMSSPVGIAAESISDGAAGKITVSGGINTHQSGLTGGASYHISLQGSAELATIQNSLPFVGQNKTLPVQAIAQSATTVYVTGFTPLISNYFRKS